jgi:tetratricopeptide (TPR) repeat protein
MITATKNFEDARKNYVAEEEKQNKISEDFLKMGNGQMALKEYDAAIVAYTKCIEASPMFLECYNYRALAYGVKKNYDAAEPIFIKKTTTRQSPI